MFDETEHILVVVHAHLQPPAQITGTQGAPLTLQNFDDDIDQLVLCHANTICGPNRWKDELRQVVLQEYGRIVAQVHPRLDHCRVAPLAKRDQGHAFTLFPHSLHGWRKVHVPCHEQCQIVCPGNVRVVHHFHRQSNVHALLLGSWGSGHIYVKMCGLHALKEAHPLRLVTGFFPHTCEDDGFDHIDHLPTASPSHQLLFNAATDESR
mmetsp:Transcript_11012/g.31591  ORF Transcript_11012/g.31591 Transcript_11012/m.31591 type:complete len:208 (-) Transcript_11012:322-945(-)